MNTCIFSPGVCCVLSALLCFSAAQAQTQEVEWPAITYPYGFLGRVHAINEGYIVTDRNDTVRGFIRTSPAYSDYPVLDTATQKITTVDYAHIVVMRLYADSTKRVYTDWLNIGYKLSLWILLAKNGQVKLYENTRPYGPELILITPREKIRLLHKGATFIHNDNDRDAPLIRFIRKRYKSSYSDFGTSGNIYNYIVDKESERIGAGNQRPISMPSGNQKFQLTYQTKQIPEDTIPYGWRQPLTSVREGYVVTTHNDTLTGFIRISPHLNDFPVQDSITHTVRTVNLKDIAVMRVYDDSSKSGYRDWYNINYRSRPWILLAKKKDVALYENTRPFWPPVVLVTPYERIRPVHKVGMFLHGFNYNHELRRFIRKRYNTTFEGAGASENIFTYIVEKESERIASGLKK